MTPRTSSRTPAASAMTGSGKTGLGIAVIEEAAIDGVPVVVRRAGKDVPAFAAEQADRWKKGLAEWGEDGMRIQRLRDSAEFTIYTPGSTAGAQLDDTQRMFFVALLLNAVAGWMRGQTGTSSLRALVYMDESFGCFPPTANPPSKVPLLTLLKQGRAAGVGVVLATQNPVDLDYKGLSNIGTWWLGRLQTERDKARLLDGLEGATDHSGFDRAEIDRLLSSLTSRVFLMRNVHEDRLTLFQSRWALSYLRGPLGRDEIKTLTAGRKASAPQPPASAGPAAASGHGVGAETARPRPGVAAARLVVPPAIAQFFSPEAVGGVVPLTPVIYGSANVRFVEPKLKLDVTRLVTWTTPIGDGAVAVDWDGAAPIDAAPELLERDAPDGAAYAAVPAPALKAKNYDAWSKQFVTAVTTKEGLDVLRSPSTGEISRPDELERDFRGRLQQAADRESQQATGQKLQTMISVGATLMSALMGRKAITATTIGRATTAARGMSRTMQESEDITRAKDTVQALNEQSQAIEDELKLETATLEAAGDPATETFERVTVKPKRERGGEDRRARLDELRRTRPGITDVTGQPGAGFRHGTARARMLSSGLRAGLRSSLTTWV